MRRWPKPVLGVLLEVSAGMTGYQTTANLELLRPPRAERLPGHEVVKEEKETPVPLTHCEPLNHTVPEVPSVSEIEGSKFSLRHKPVWALCYCHLQPKEYWSVQPPCPKALPALPTEGVQQSGLRAPPAFAFGLNLSLISSRPRATLHRRLFPKHHGDLTCRVRPKSPPSPPTQSSSHSRPGSEVASREPSPKSLPHPESQRQLAAASLHA